MRDLKKKRLGERERVLLLEYRYRGLPNDRQQQSVLPHLRHRQSRSRSSSVGID